MNNFLTAIIGIVTFVSVLFLWKHNLLLLILLICLAVILLLMNKSKQEIKIFFLCAFAGATAEIFTIFFGVWVYKNPNFLNIPIWLFVLWGIASIFIIRLYLFFKE